jgi:hypothetical protein
MLLAVQGMALTVWQHPQALVLPAALFVVLVCPASAYCATSRRAPLTCHFALQAGLGELAILWSPRSNSPKLPLLICIPIAVFIFSTVLFLLLVSWLRHTSLVEAMLPASALAAVKTGQIYAGE